MAARIVKISDLKPGDRFSFIPAAWHGPRVCREVSDSGHCWHLTFENWQIINPPGSEYTKKEPDEDMNRLHKRLGWGIEREQRVRLLGRFWRGDKGYRTY
jgi:hypothetical protein